jgi:hypothetical protein
MNTKVCASCKEAKTLDNFYSQKRKSGVTHRNKCKLCMTSERNARLAEDHEVFLALVFQNAKTRRPEGFNIELDDIIDLYYQQRGRCALSGRRMTHKREGVGDGHTDNISIDRIDSSIGYRKGNVQLICSTINFMKRSLADEQFIELCRDVASYNE